MQLPNYQKYIIIFFIFAFFSCSGSIKNREINFYHWKTSIDNNENQKAYLHNIGLKKLYVRFFDVKWVETEKQAYPFATLQNGLYDTTYQIVPTVFITNEAIKNTSQNKIANLANEIADKIKRLCKQQFYQQTNNQGINEIQIDCDWTESSKEKYFELLEKIKNSEHLAELNQPLLSATIRLHQVKYHKKTGIPPVNRGMLMFYNMGDLQNIETENSILDLEITKKYIKYFNNYPLLCDVALPLYSWAVVFRDKRSVKLIYGLSSDELKQHKKFKHLKNNQFKVIEDNYINKQFVYKDDELRIEEVDQEKLEKLMEMIKDNANDDKFSVCFYHLDEEIIKSFNAGDLKTIANK